MSVHIDIYIPDSVEEVELEDEDDAEEVEPTQPFHLELRY